VTPSHPGAIRNPVQARGVAINERDQVKAGDFSQGRQMALLDGQTTSDYGQP
jgi:hypothetical protein